MVGEDVGTACREAEAKLIAIAFNDRRPGRWLERGDRFVAASRRRRLVNDRLSRTYGLRLRDTRLGRARYFRGTRRVRHDEEIETVRRVTYEDNRLAVRRHIGPGRSPGGVSEPSRDRPLTLVRVEERRPVHGDFIELEW